MRESVITIIILCLVTSIIPIPLNGEEIREEGWPIPDLKGLVPYSIFIQRVGEVEKMVERFHTLDGGHVARISGNGKVFAYAVDRDREPPMDHFLLDINGYGKFTIKLTPNESYMIPEWIFH